MNKLFSILVFLSVFPAFSIAQITIHIQSLPANTPENADIYFAGDINAWNPGDPDFILDKRNDGDLWLDLAQGNGTIQFKFTRGSWTSVESNGNGGFRPNRSYTYGNGDTLHLDILGWEDLDQGGTNSTANDQVQIWDTSMTIPQLNRNRRIWVYLPQDYDHSGKDYPVLYMQDGQNVFDAYTSFAGEWEVDESLVDLENDGYFGVIVVAIDNGGSHRLDEYSPFVHPDYGGGEGDDYLDFIIETLKPKIDSSFRTKPEPVYTGIMGSSMGGLIAHYAHFRNPEIFGRVGIFSPSYWFSNDFFIFTENSGKTDSSRLFLLAGEGESSIAAGSQQMYDLLLDLGYSSNECQLNIVSDGVHSEWFWAREFSDAILWLFPEEEISRVDDPGHDTIELYPNPTKDTLQIKGKGKMQVRIYDVEGRLLQQNEIIDQGRVAVKNKIPGNKIVVQISRLGTIISEQIVILE